MATTLAIGTYIDDIFILDILTMLKLFLLV